LQLSLGKVSLAQTLSERKIKKKIKERKLKREQESLLRGKEKQV
jgi:hypothetical protein